MARHWTLDDIPWDRFDAAQVDPDILAVVKAASMVEANAADYVRYLENVFRDDEEFLKAARAWGVEEEQHGAALGRWAEIADPGFSFADSLAEFRRGFRVPLDSESSIRGSRAGELIARQVVETGTSSFYSALRDASDEPVLKEICRRIAIDEFFHYQLFQKHFRRYRERDRPGILERLKVALGRVQEAEDDELAYAYYAANVWPRDPAHPYRREECGRDYWVRAMALYRPRHIDSATRMILRAAELKANGRLADLAARGAFALVRWRCERLRRDVAAAARAA
ncbi:MAG: ferritin-like domain-containing protein [Alphaproteobacteria bacterium]|nr:MAG: ferritin-like domain-containing protein [Alphaproteobacteria bacterium]